MSALEPRHWYVQRFRGHQGYSNDEQIYFYGLAYQKNGGTSGIEVSTFGRNRRGKKSSVRREWAHLWDDIPLSLVPTRILREVELKLETCVRHKDCLDHPSLGQACVNATARDRFRFQSRKPARRRRRRRL